MSDLISRKDAIELAMQLRNLLDDLENLPSAQPDNQINLCDSCDYSYPDCPSKNCYVIFGNGIGNDNICACNNYRPSEQPDDWMERNKDLILQAGMEGREIEFYIGSRLFAIREKAQ